MSKILDQRGSSVAKKDTEMVTFSLPPKSRSEESLDDERRRISRLPTPARNEMITTIQVQAAAGDSNDGSDSLEDRLDSLGMRMAEMEADGNCQFRALAFNLFGSQAYHGVTRAAAVAHMQKHADFFGLFFDGQEEFEEYLEEMAWSGTWGDELTLRAAVEAYGCIAHVITSEAANWYLVYKSEHEEPPNSEIAIYPREVPRPKHHKRIFLSYYSPVHYNAIVAKTPTIARQEDGQDAWVSDGIKSTATWGISAQRRRKPSSDDAAHAPRGFRGWWARQEGTEN
jgi:hypothetical protein